MSLLKVVGWDHWVDEKVSLSNSLGSSWDSYVFFGKIPPCPKTQVSWEDDVLKHERSDFVSYAEALKKEILEKNIKFSGRDHTNELSKGVPVFSDGSYGMFSARGWATFMAAVWSCEKQEGFCYMAFY